MMTCLVGRRSMELAYSEPAMKNMSGIAVNAVTVQRFVEW